VWCGDVADLVEPLYRRMADGCDSRMCGYDDTILPMLSPGKTKRARMWVYVGETRIIPTTCSTSRSTEGDGPKQF